MNTVFFNIVMALFWAVLFIGMYFRTSWMSVEMQAMVENERTPLVMWGLVVLLMWNVTRAYVRRRFSVVRSNITPEMRAKVRSITGTDPKVTDPQFNFDDPQPPK
jgi:hypothetical protein